MKPDVIFGGGQLYDVFNITIRVQSLGYLTMQEALHSNSFNDIPCETS